MGNDKLCRHNTPLTDACAECELGAAATACSRILVKLQLLSEVTPAVLEHRGGRATGRPRLSKDEAVTGKPLTMKPKPESSVPQGVNTTNVVESNAATPPSRELSLYAHYRWRMQRAVRRKARTELLVLAAMASRDYDELVEPRRMVHDATDTNAIERLLKEWQGCSAEETAVWMRVAGQTPRSARLWVRRQRILAGCDPDDGMPRAQDEKLAMVVRMKRAGATLALIASEVGMSVAGVQHLLQGE